MAEIQAVMNSQELAELNRNVTDYNARLRSDLQKLPQQAMGRDEFLKLLLTQLANQDPTAPIEDREFIAQMAQFSSLEQMTNMASDFARLTRLMQSSEAANSLGKSVDLLDGDRLIQGQLMAVSRDENPRVMVNGSFYNWDQVTRVYYEGDSDI